MRDVIAEAVQADLDAARPSYVPPFAVIRAARARRLRLRSQAAVAGCALAVAGVVVVPPLVAGPGGGGDTSAGAARTVGGTVPQGELLFGTPEQDAAGPGRVLTPEVDGVSVVGYRNAAGTVCTVDLPAGYPVCFPDEPGFRAPGDQVVLLGPADPPGPRATGTSRAASLTFGYAPTGSRSVRLERGGRTVEVTTHPAGEALGGVAYWLAPFDSDPVGPGQTYTALDRDGAVLATRVRPAAATPADAIRAVQDAVSRCLDGKGYPSSTAGGGRSTRISGPGVPYEEAKKRFDADTLTCQRSVGLNLVAPPPYERTTTTGPADPPVRVLPARADDPALGRVVLPARVASGLTDLPPENGVADLLARTSTPGGRLYLVGVSRVSGKLRACTTAFTDAPGAPGGGISCTGGQTVYGDLAADAIGTGGSWTVEPPERRILEGSAPAGTTRVRVQPENGPSVELAVSSSGARWGGRVFFVADVPRGPAKVTALDGQGRELATGRSPGA